MKGHNEKRCTKISKRLWVFIKPYKVWFLARVVSTIGKAVIDMLVAYFVFLLVDSAVKLDMKVLKQSIYFMVGFVCVGIIIYFMETYSAGRFTSQVVRSVREKLIEHVEQLPISYFENNHSGELISRLSNDVNILENFLGGSFMDMFFHIIRFTASFVVALFISWNLLFFCMVVIPVAFFITNKVSAPLKSYQEALCKDVVKVNSLAQDSIGGIHLIKAYNLKEILYKKYKNEVENNLNNSFKIEKRMAIISAFSVVIQIIPFALCFLYGGYLVTSNKLSLAQFMAFMTMLSNILQSASALPVQTSNYKGSLGIMTHIFEVLDYDIECSTGSHDEIDKSLCAIEFDNVTFSYCDDRKILNGLSFKIDNRKVTALVGTSGGGKTTIFKLICGFYKAEGSIRIYGKDIKEWNLSYVRENISLVSQDPYLFPRSIAENISYGRLESSFEEVIAAAKLANAHEFIMELPDGYKTIIGERGITLSGGQKQRISMARAILKDAPILLLDEPTSALDMESELKIQQALQTLMEDRTVFIIAHRLSTIKDADNILVLDKGNIKEYGSHQELMSKDGVYKKLNMNQITGRNVENQGA